VETIGARQRVVFRKWVSEHRDWFKLVQSAIASLVPPERLAGAISQGGRR